MRFTLQSRCASLKRLHAALGIGDHRVGCIRASGAGPDYLVLKATLLAMLLDKGFGGRQRGVRPLLADLRGDHETHNGTQRHKEVKT